MCHMDITGRGLGNRAVKRSTGAVKMSLGAAGTSFGALLLLCSQDCWGVAGSSAGADQEVATKQLLKLGETSSAGV